MRKQVAIVLAVLTLMLVLMPGCGVLGLGSAGFREERTTPVPETQVETVPPTTEAPFTVPSVQEWVPSTDSEDFFGEFIDTGIAGKSEFNTYKNSVFGFQFSPDSTWLVLSEEMVLEANNILTDELSKIGAEAIAEVITSGKAATVMLATTAFNDNINVIVQPDGGMNAYVYQFMLPTIAETMQEEFQTYGYKDAEVSVGDIYVLGEQKPCLVVQMNGIYQKQFTLFDGEYMCVVTISASGEEAVDKIALFFEAYP